MGYGIMMLFPNYVMCTVYPKGSPTISMVSTVQIELRLKIALRSFLAVGKLPFYCKSCGNIHRNASFQEVNKTARLNVGG